MSESMYNRSSKLIQKQNAYASKAYDYAKKGSNVFNEIRDRYGNDAVKDLNPALVKAGEDYFKSWMRKTHN